MAGINRQWGLAVALVVLVLVQAALMIYQLAAPQVIVFEYLTLPVIVSVVFALPAATGLLAGLAVVFGIIVAAGNGYFTDLNSALLLGLTALASVAAWGLSVLVRRLTRQRDLGGRRLDAVMDAALDAHVRLIPVTDQAGDVRDFRYLHANTAACEFLGKDAAELVGTVMTIVTPHFAETLVDRLAHLAAEGEPLAIDDVRFGSQRHADLRAVVVDGEVCVAWRDTTATLQAHQQLQAAEARFALLAKQTPDVIVQIDADGALTWLSPSAGRILGWDPDALIGTGALRLVPPEDVPAAAKVLSPGQGTGAVSGSFRVIQADRSRRWVEAASDTLGGSLPGRVIRLRDAEAQVRAAQELERLARVEPLTGMANRRQARRQLEALRTRRQTDERDAVLFLDLDRFTEINDNYGHAAGDMVMRRLGERITNLIRTTDMAARVGGDELLVILPGVGSMAKAVDIAEKVHQTCAEPIELAGGIRLSTTVSVGVALSRGDEPIDQLIRRADSALYRAKQAGRDQVVADWAGSGVAS